MEENHKSEKGAFPDIIELLRKENSFLSKENELLQKQIELYRSEKKVNEQRNLSYQRKLEYVLKIISSGLGNYDNRELPDENGGQNYDDNKSDNAFRQIQDKHREAQNENSEQKNLLQLRNYEHGQQQDEHRLQNEVKEMHHEAHELQFDDNEQNSDEHEHNSNDNKQNPGELEQIPDDNKITSNDKSKEDINNKIISKSYIHEQNESESLKNENEELSGSNVNFIQSQMQPQKDNEGHNNGNEKMSGSELISVNENDSSVNNNVKLEDESENEIKDNDSSVNDNVNVINEHVKPLRGNTDSSKSLKKQENDNGELSGKNRKVDKYENKEYKEFVQVIYENLKVSFSKKYAKKMMDRYVREMIFLMGNKKVSLGELCTAMNTSVSTMMRDLAIFKRKGWVKYYGTSKFGYYRITDEGMKMGEERAFDN